jgi:hypothetical protein
MRPEPRGFPAISRWLNAAIPPERGHAATRIPGCQKPAGIPSGCGMIREMPSFPVVALR